MIPYENFHFFLWLLIPLVPAALLGFLGVPARVRALWVLLATVTMAVVMLSPLQMLAPLAVFFVLQWLIAILYLAYRQSAKGQNKAWVFYLAVALAITPLVLVKANPYLSLTNPLGTPIGFMGISYLTFRAVGTVIEIRDGLIKKIHLLDFISYMLFFPTLASGPIDRYRRFTADLHKALPRREYASLLVEGIEHIFRGFLYKFIMAYLINRYWLQPLTDLQEFGATVQYMYAYGLYLFFDFAGYSAFAVGVSYILGVKTPENFQRPFLAKNIKDFWNRWHRSLSFWFRDYVYMRFVLDSAKKKRFKNRLTSSYVGYILLFGMMGVWHGTQLHYIAYGLYHATIMIGYDLLERRKKTLRFWGQGLFWDALGILITFNFVMFGFLIFSGRLF